MSFAEHLNCCAEALPVTRRTLLDTTHESEELRECEGCGAWWFYRYHEYVGDSGDSATQWYSLLTAGQAASVLETEGQPDLTFLTDCATFMRDQNGVRSVAGQPTHAFYGKPTGTG